MVTLPSLDPHVAVPGRERIEDGHCEHNRGRDVIEPGRCPPGEDHPLEAGFDGGVVVGAVAGLRSG